MSRHTSRVIAFQALYSWDANNHNLDEILNFGWLDEKDSADQDSLVFARLLIAGTVDCIEEVDSIIKRNLTPKWDFSRLNKVTLAILRLSIYSIFHQKDTPSAVAIDEAIEIAKQYGTDDSFKFINGLLDSVIKNEPQAANEA